MSGSQTACNNPKLVLADVCKHFGGVVAAQDINMELSGGEVLGLIGPNGAGKTTLINLITGVYGISKGSIRFKGREISGMPVYKRAMMGIGRTFQHPHLLGRCDILTNIVQGSDMANRRGRHSRQENTELLKSLMKCAGMEEVDWYDPVDKLAYGQQKRLEVVRVLLSRPDVILLDEPAAGLNNRETESIADLIHEAVSRDIGVLLIEHSMDLVMNVCDQITVLNFGHQIAYGTPSEIQCDAKVIEAYLGGGKHVNH